MMTTCSGREWAAGWAGVLLWLVTAVAGAEPVTCRAELDRPVLPADRDGKVVVKVSLVGAERPAGGQRPPVNLAVVLDRSGSMSGDKLEKAKQAAVAALRRLGPQDLFSLVIYDHQVETVVPAQSAGNAEWIEGRIAGIRAGGNTALFGGVSQGAAEVRKNLDDRRRVPRLLLLSDGQANVGPSSPDDLGRLGVALGKEGISVSTVGVGTDYNEDLMTRLAQSSDGNSYFVESSADLPRIFGAELGEVLNVVARKVVIEIECRDGVRLERLIGREGRISGNRAEIGLNQLYGGQTKYALLEVTVPRTPAGQTRPLVSARCSYEDAGTQQAGQTATEAAARFTQDPGEVIRAANPRVQADLATNVIALAKDQAVELTDAGKRDTAVQNLRQQSTELRRLGEQYGNSSLVQQSATLEQQAESLATKGMDARTRKAYRTDSFQDRNQQMAR